MDDEWGGEGRLGTHRREGSVGKEGRAVLAVVEDGGAGRLLVVGVGLRRRERGHARVRACVYGGRRAGEDENAMTMTTKRHRKEGTGPQ